jgi:hypothetical protein
VAAGARSAAKREKDKDPVGHAALASRRGRSDDHGDRWAAGTLEATLANALAPLEAAVARMSSTLEARMQALERRMAKLEQASTAAR